MDRDAQKVWRRVVREMRGSDVILAADADVLRCYVEAVARYAQAAELYAKSSPLMRRDGELVRALRRHRLGLTGQRPTSGTGTQAGRPCDLSSLDDTLTGEISP